MRWLILILLAFLLWRWLSLRRRSLPPETRPSEAMVRCAECQLHVPVTEAVAESGHHFCSPAHARVHAQRKS